MIEYEPRAWLPILFRVRGSVVPRLLPRIIVCAAFGIAAVLLLERENVKIPPFAHTLVGVALGLLLVFRTNASYDRYWEGRKLLGGMVNRTRDLARQVARYVTDAGLRAELGRLIRAYYWSSSSTLQRSDSLEKLRPLLSEEQMRTLAATTTRAPVVLAWISNRLRSEA